MLSGLGFRRMGINLVEGRHELPKMYRDVHVEPISIR